MEKNDQIAMKKIIHSVLDERESIGEEKHRRHHEFLDYLEAKAKRKMERMEKVKTTVFGWIVITLIIGVGSIAWQGFIHLIKATKQGE